MSKVYNSEGTYLGSIRSNGEMYTDLGEYIGSIRSNGEIYDDRGNYIGVIWENGYIYINGTYLGLIDKNGDVYMDGRYVGHVSDYRGPGSGTSTSTSSSANTGSSGSSKTSTKQSSQSYRHVPSAGGTTGDGTGIGGAFMGGLCLAAIAIVYSIIQFGISCFNEAIAFTTSTGVVPLLAIATSSTGWIDWFTTKERDNKTFAKWAVLLNAVLNAGLLLVIKFGFNQFTGKGSEIIKTIIVGLICGIIMAIVSFLIHKAIEKMPKKNTIGMWMAIVGLLFAFAFSYAMYESGDPAFLRVDPNYLDWDALVDEYGTEDNDYDYSDDDYVDQDDTDDYSDDDYSDDEYVEEDDSYDEDDSYEEEEIEQYNNESGEAESVSDIESPYQFTTEDFHGKQIAFPDLASYDSDEAHDAKCVLYNSYNMRIDYYYSSIDGGSAYNHIKNNHVSDEEIESMTKYSEILYKPEDGIYVYTQNYDGELTYVLIRAYDDSKKYYEMDIKYDLPDSKVDQNHIGYIIDCLYRYSDFGRDVGEPRTYDEFMN